MVTLLVARLALASVLHVFSGHTLPVATLMECQSQSVAWGASWSEMYEACNEGVR